MKIHILVINLFVSACMTSHAERLVFPLLLPESQSNIIVTAAPEHSKACPLEYTNLMSNTNLFSPAEQSLLRQIHLQYNGVTTNSGPLGTIFKGVELRQWKSGERVVKTFSVSCFDYTNFNARDEIAFLSQRQIMIVFRTQDGNGYNVNLIDGRLAQYQEYKNGVLDGLYVGQVFDNERCNYWARFVKGRIVGKFLGWNEDGEIDMEAEFKEPFDFSKNAIGKFDRSWDRVSARQTDSVRGKP